MSNLGRGVNWSAFQHIAGMFAQAGEAKARGISQGLAGLSAGLERGFARRDLRQQEERQKQAILEERAFRASESEKDRAMRRELEKTSTGFQQQSLDLQRQALDLNRAEAEQRRRVQGLDVGLRVQTGIVEGLWRNMSELGEIAKAKISKDPASFQEQDRVEFQSANTRLNEEIDKLRQMREEYFNYMRPQQPAGAEPGAMSMPRPGLVEGMNPSAPAAVAPIPALADANVVPQGPQGEGGVQGQPAPQPAAQPPAGQRPMFMVQPHRDISDVSQEPEMKLAQANIERTMGLVPEMDIDRLRETQSGFMSAIESGGGFGKKKAENEARIKYIQDNYPNMTSSTKAEVARLSNENQRLGFMERAFVREATRALGVVNAHIDSLTEKRTGQLLAKAQSELQSNMSEFMGMVAIRRANGNSPWTDEALQRAAEAVQSGVSPSAAIAQLDKDFETGAGTQRVGVGSYGVNMRWSSQAINDAEELGKYVRSPSTSMFGDGKYEDYMKAHPGAKTWGDVGDDTFAYIIMTQRGKLRDEALVELLKSGGATPNFKIDPKKPPADVDGAIKGEIKKRALIMDRMMGVIRSSAQGGFTGDAQRALVADMMKTLGIEKTYMQWSGERNYEEFRDEKGRPVKVVPALKLKGYAPVLVEGGD